MTMMRMTTNMSKRQNSIEFFSAKDSGVHLFSRDEAGESRVGPNRAFSVQSIYRLKILLISNQLHFSLLNFVGNVLYFTSLGMFFTSLHWECSLLHFIGNVLCLLPFGIRCQSSTIVRATNYVLLSFHRDYRSPAVGLGLPIHSINRWYAQYDCLQRKVSTHNISLAEWFSP